MSRILEDLQRPSTEDEFEAMIRGRRLTVEERESLRKHFGLPCNEALVSCLTNWHGYATMAMQKIREDTVLCC